MVISNTQQSLTMISNDAARYWCKLCLERFDSPHKVNHHITTCHGNHGNHGNPDKVNVLSSEAVLLNTENKMVKRIKVRPAQNPRIFKCERVDCGMRFTRWTNLKRHMLTHTGEKPYPCKVEGCGKRFSQLGNLHTHMYTHTGERPYQCTKCSKAYNQSTALKRHMRCHTGEKPFTCPHCNKSFSNSTHLSTHLRTHTGERPFQCDHCDKKFTQYSSLHVHMKTHVQRPYPCDKCSSSFFDRGTLKRHMISHDERTILSYIHEPHLIHPDPHYIHSDPHYTHSDPHQNNIMVSLEKPPNWNMNRQLATPVPKERKPAFPTAPANRVLIPGGVADLRHKIVSPIAMYPPSYMMNHGLPTQPQTSPIFHRTSPHTPTLASPVFEPSPKLPAPNSGVFAAPEPSVSHQHLALSSLLVFSNLLATTTAALKFSASGHT